MDLVPTTISKTLFGSFGLSEVPVDDRVKIIKMCLYKHSRKMSILCKHPLWYPHSLCESVHKKNTACIQTARALVSQNDYDS